MAPMLSSALHLWALVACASAVIAAGVRSMRAPATAESLWMAVGVVPVVHPSPAAGDAVWRPAWRSPDDDGPGRVPYRLLRRVKVSRPIHAP
jgi:hypothetical protein